MTIIRILTMSLLLLAYLLYPSEPGYSQVEKLYPVDEATRDPSLFIFRARLLEAVQQRDTTFITGSMSPDILSSFGGVGGIAEFKEMWKPEQPNSKLWPELATVLALGGSFQKDGVFVAPYTFTRFPEKLKTFGRNYTFK